MERKFVPKKTITVQLTLDMWKKFEELCVALGLTKTKTFERMIQEMERTLNGDGN